MDIAAMSMGMAQANLAQQVSVSVTKKAMDLAEVQMDGLVDMMRDMTPSFGHSLDIRV